MRTSLVVLGLCLAFAPSTARAQEGGLGLMVPTQTVTLVDGSVYRGELVEKIPGDHLTLKLATGEIKVFRWADLVVDGQQAPLGGASQVVEVTSDKPGTELYRYSGIPTAYGMTIETAQRVCSAPCRAAVDPSGRYFVGGDGISPSDRFSLSPRQGPLRLRVAAGSASQRGWGWVTISLGITTLVVGGTFFLVGKLIEPDPSDSKYKGSAASNLSSDQSSADRWKSMGYWTLGAGTLLTGLGIFLVATSGTDVVDDTGATIAMPRVKLPGKLVATPAGILF